MSIHVLDPADFWAKFPIAYGSTLFLVDGKQEELKQIIEIPELGVKITYPPSSKDKWLYKNSCFYEYIGNEWVKRNITGTYDVKIQKIVQISF